MAKTPAPEIQCPACKGCGRVALPENLKSIVAILKRRKPGAEVTAAELFVQAKGDGARSVFNNRLEKLRDTGLVTRRRESGVWKYSLAETGGN